MPTVHREKGYKFYFVMFDLNEPAHLHIDKQGKTAKFWLSPVRIARNQGYANQELREIESIINANLQKLLGIWKSERAKIG